MEVAVTAPMTEIRPMDAIRGTSAPQFQAVYHPQSGIATLDAAVYSAPVGPIELVELLRNGLSMAIVPAQPLAQIVAAPGVGSDVIIRLLDPIRRLERDPAPDLRPRAATLRAGSLIAIPEGLATDWYLPNGQPRVLHLHIGATLRETMHDEAGRGLERQLKPRIGWDVSSANAMFERMERLGAATGPLDRLELQGLGLAATAAILRASGVLATRNPSQAMTPARLRRVRAYVEENLGREVCLDEMAGCVGLSTSHFARAFRAETGISPYAFVVQARVKRAKDQLLNSRRSLAEIAIDCGFATQSHMTETFRRVTGLPPARWLRVQGRDAEGEA
jgi:AraC-like DNA-binding protein